MTKEEILKAADEAVDEHRMILISNNQFSSKNFFKEATDHAILQYEKILELRIVFLERIKYLHEEGDLTNYVLICKDEVIDAESILTELKSRL